MLGLFVASLLASAAAAQPRDAADAASAAGDAGVRLRAPELSPYVRDPGGWRREVGVGFHSTNFWSKESSHYAFYSLGVNFRISKGSWGPFLDVGAYVPLQARQDGRVYAASHVYGDRIGGDILLGWQRRWDLPPRAEVEFGPGLHMTALWMPGAQGYRDFSAFPMGLGVETAMRWSTGQHIGGSALRVGWYATATFDFYDPLRGNDLRYGVAFMAGAMFGLDQG